MVSPDEFYRQTNQNFATVFEKIDEIKEDVSNLQSAYNSHIAVGEALEKTRKLSRTQKVAIFFGVTPILVAIYAIFR